MNFSGCNMTASAQEVGGRMNGLLLSKDGRTQPKAVNPTRSKTHGIQHTVVQHHGIDDILYMHPVSYTSIIVFNMCFPTGGAGCFLQH